ncbi:hypothetical protein L5I01_01500 [Gordonia sp. HY442]|uniref:hypothetical protein n=1 Tax=Gordonia zhenghanii TaxID=2911516 RepID=UPI001F241EAF|nr:hypothetical protein [Gordonia zhenghanii]MCF8601958.1 hypothetical protein [Gordonia zhenghanii]MCF8602026.1 hypothetical protein [Gordonia zhenghanii]
MGVATVQGYGQRGAVGTIALLALLTLSGCGLLSAQGTPDRIVIPSTDQLSTETKPSTLSETSKTNRSQSNDIPSEWSFERVIKSAPRVSNSEFQMAASKKDGTREDVSGYHFSSADREIRCSTGNNGANALVCTSDTVKGPKSAPAKEDPDCSWNRELAVLSSDGVSEGGCANRYSVLFRSRSIPSGSAISVGRFACLSQDTDVYCVESDSGTGFALTEDGYTEIRADARAPKSLTGVDDETSESTSYSRVVPTR